MDTLRNSLKQRINVVECRVCEDVFTVQGDRVPRLLYCGHTVCQACLLRLPLGQETILCPFDRQPTPIGPSGVWGLKKNFALLELLEKLQETERETCSSEKDGSDGCDGPLFCSSCKSTLCSACSHPRGVCRLCAQFGASQQTKSEPGVEVEAERIRTMVSMTMQTSQELIEQINQTIHRLEETVNGMEGGGGSLETALSRVGEHFEELRRRLDLEEAGARSTVEAHARERLSYLRSTRDDLVQRLAQVVSTLILCESALSSDDTRLVSSEAQIRRATLAVRNHWVRYKQLSPDHFSSDIIITFTKDNRVHIGPKIEMRVVALGLDGAGKTSILFKLKQNEFMSLPPTIGFNVETIEYKNLRFNIWDIGGQPKLRPLWKHYFLNTQAVLFVVDSSDRARLSEAGVELTRLVGERDLKDAALLILANKQDLVDSCGLETLTEELGVAKLCSSHSWHLQPVSAQTGLGLNEGLDWLSGQLVAASASSTSTSLPEGDPPLHHHPQQQQSL